MRRGALEQQYEELHNKWQCGMKYFLFRQFFSEPIQHLFFELHLTKYPTCNLEREKRERENCRGLTLTTEMKTDLIWILIFGLIKPVKSVKSELCHSLWEAFVS